MFDSLLILCRIVKTNTINGVLLFLFCKFPLKLTNLISDNAFYIKQKIFKHVSKTLKLISIQYCMLIFPIT